MTAATALKLRDAEYAFARHDADLVDLATLLRSADTLPCSAASLSVAHALRSLRDAWRLCGDDVAEAAIMAETIADAPF